MNSKTRVLHVRVVGFSAPERQMLNSIFLLSVAPARQIGYKLWIAEAGVAPDMYLLDGDSDSAVASWQATFSSTADRTLVVGSKNTDLGVASAARPLGLKVVGAMDRLAIALSNVAKEPVAPEPRAARTLPSSAAAESMPAAKAEAARSMTSTTLQQPVIAPASHAASMNATLSSAAAVSPNAATLTATHVNVASSVLPAMGSAMTAAAPVATVLPHVTLQPNVAPLAREEMHPVFEKSQNEKPVTEKTVDRILSDKALERSAVDKFSEIFAETGDMKPAAVAPSSGVTPLTPAALSAAVAPTSRANLRVVKNESPLANSLPSATGTMARIAEAPMNPSPASAPAVTPAVAGAAAIPVVVPTPLVAATVARVAEVPAAPVVAPPAAPAVVATPAPAATIQVTPATAPAYTPNVPTARHEEQVFRVLAVDDSPLMRTFLQNKLAPYGIQPEFAASGEEALFKISKTHYDMIFLDVMLPGMDGYDVCKMIKKNKDNSLMKVVMLTSKDKTFDKIRGTMAGCDGYLTKPVDEMKLRAIIERHTVTRK
jgi:two-component system cell cycle response regulator